MCGITGFVSKKNISKLTLEKMTNSLFHRGPDSFGSFFEKSLNNISIGLGHRRLSILDLSDRGTQPMQYNENIIIYNGEVYNYKEIKEDLIRIGYKFQTDTDTEVILKSYNEWGINFINKLNGMFAIVIFDKKKDKIFLIRDRVGVKPLYYYLKDGLFMFTSELKSFHQNNQFDKKLNLNALESYFQYGYIPEPQSIFFYAKKLKGGHYLEVDTKNISITEIKYWDPVNFLKKDKVNIDYPNVLNEVEKRLDKSFEYRMVSDVPVGIFLSGGYDSSLVAALLQKNTSRKIKTFTIGFNDNEFDESNYANKISKNLGTQHFQKYCTGHDAVEIFKDLPNIYDEPFGDPSSIPTVLLSKFTRSHVKASLSADGGDEIFGGYNKYKTVAKFFNLSKFCPKILSHFIPDINLKNFSRNINLKYYFFQNLFKKDSSIELMQALTSVFAPSEIKDLVITDNGSNKEKTNFELIKELRMSTDFKDKLLVTDMKTYLIDDILVKVDRATMSVGLEGRDPLLDHNLIEFMLSVQSEFKFDKINSKQIIKDIAKKYIPKKFLERPKMGFSPPLKSWLTKEFKPIIAYYFNETKLQNIPTINSKLVLKIYKDFLNGKSENFFKIWLILIFLSWHERWN